MKASNKDKQARIKELISEFKLNGTENTYVGGENLKGVSGGQRKRVNICLELIADPPVLFLDEPTSGLDAYTAEVLVKKLNELATKYNKTIIYVIHQPSSEIFRKIDKLMLLYRGKTIYFGNSGTSVVNHFSKIGFVCDENTNPSDYFMYIMQSKQEGLEKFLTGEYEKNPLQIDSTAKTPIKVSSSNMPGVGAQFGALFNRSFKMVLRNPAHTFVRIAQVIGIAIFFVSIYFNLNDDPQDPTSTFNRNGALFIFCLSNFIPPMMAQLISCKFLSNFSPNRKSSVHQRVQSQILRNFPLLYVQDSNRSSFLNHLPYPLLRSNLLPRRFQLKFRAICPTK
jgi:energy-coupling factor transporter ATP-binding protein EcfA2